MVKVRLNISPNSDPTNIAMKQNARKSQRLIFPERYWLL